MSNVDFEEQARRLLSGEVSVKVQPQVGVETRVEQPIRLEDLPEQVQEEVKRFSPDAHHHELVMEQSRAIVAIRLASGEVVNAEQAANEELEAALADSERRAQSTTDEADRVSRSIAQQEQMVQKALGGLQMQYMLANPASVGELPDEKVNVETLYRLEREATKARSRLYGTVDGYARWWLIRLSRLVVTVLILLFVVWVMIRATSLTVGGLAGMYVGVRSWATRFDSAFVEYALWYLFVALTICAFGVALFFAVRAVKRRFFETGDKRRQTQMQLVQRRSDLVNLVFATDENVTTKSFWGRMLVMSWFAVRIRLSASNPATTVDTD